MDTKGTGCTTEIQSSARSKGWKLWFFGWIPVGIGLLSWIIPGFDPESPYAALRVVGFLTAVTVSIIIHEVAHFVAAQILGLKPWAMRIGHGEVVFDKQFKNIRLILKALPYSGIIYPFQFLEPAYRARWRQFLMVLAGPLSNILLLAFFVFVAARSAKTLDLATFPGQMLFANAYLVFWSIFPRETNDGMILLNLVRNRPTRGRSRKDPEYTPSWDWTVRHVSADALLNQYRNLLSHPNLTSDQKCLLLDSFATTVLMYGASEYLADADRYSEELLCLKPDDWSIKGTRGGVLVEKGDIAAGAAMLSDLMLHDSNAFDRSIAASFLALAELKNGCLDGAHKWLKTSEQIDPACPALVRIKEALMAKSQPS